MQALAEIERRFPVVQWTVASIPIWPLIRVRWFLGEWARHYTTPTGARAGAQVLGLATRLVSGPARAVLAQWRDRERLPRGPSRRDLLFLSDGVSYGRLGGHWLERFCDPVIRAARARGLTSLLLSPTYAFHLPRATPSRFIQPKLDRANALGVLLARVSCDAHLPEIGDVCAWVAAQGYSASMLQPDRVASDGMRMLALSWVHARIVRRTRPRLAFVVNYYGIEGMAFVLACRQSGVAVVDLQHGAQYELHPAYAAWPKPVGRVHALLPDRFWVWSDWERDLIASWAVETGHRAVVGGNPWMSIWQEDSRWDGLADATARVEALVARASGKPAVLITLQWGLKREEQLEPMQRLIAGGQGRFEFWVRLHPSMLERREEVRAVLKSAGRYELDEPTDLPLQPLLSRSAVHVTHSSSTAIEAAQLGVPTVLTSELGGELFGPVLRADWTATETGGADKVLARLRELAARKRSSAARERVPLNEVLGELLAEAP